MSRTTAKSPLCRDTCQRLGGALTIETRTFPPGKDAKPGFADRKTLEVMHRAQQVSLGKRFLVAMKDDTIHEQLGDGTVVWLAGQAGRRVIVGKRRRAARVVERAMLTSGFQWGSNLRIDDSAHADRFRRLAVSCPGLRGGRFMHFLSLPIAGQLALGKDMPAG